MSPIFVGAAILTSSAIGTSATVTVSRTGAAGAPILPGPAVTFLSPVIA